VAPAPHLVQALQDGRALAEQRDDLAGWKALYGSTTRILERLDTEDVDPAYTEMAETDGTLGPDLDPDVVDRAVGSLTALEEVPDTEQLELALQALEELELLVR
jgi:hypothetical protein